MLFQMLSLSVIAIVLAIGVAPEKALPALVAQAGENKNNAKAKEEKKIKVEFEENYVNVNGELALVGKISISSNVNIDSVYDEIMQEAKKRIIVVVIRDDLLNPKHIHFVDRKSANFIKNAYFEKMSDCKIKMFEDIEIFSKLEKDAFNNKELETNKKLMDVINNFEK